MNNGQTNGINPVGFTPGVGDNAPIANPGMDESLNSDFFTPNTDPRKFGNNAMNALGAPGENEIPNMEQFGMPPGYQPEQLAPEETNDANGSNPKEPTASPVIKTKETLNKEGFKAIEGARHELDRTGDIADFNDKIRKMMEDNLKNSYNREVGK